MGPDKIIPIAEDVLEYSDDSDIELDDDTGELVVVITERVIERNNLEIIAEQLENPQLLLEERREVILDRMRRQNWARLRTQLRDRVRERIDEFERRLEIEARAQAEADRHEDLRDPRGFDLARASGSGVDRIAGPQGTSNSEGEPSNINVPGTPHDPASIVNTSDDEDEGSDIQG